MAMTECLADVVYEKRDFLYDRHSGRHPLELTERHYRYHLMRDHTGRLDYRRGRHNGRVRSPRRLGDLCLYAQVGNISRLRTLPPQLLPSNLHALLLSEAIFQREAATIQWVVSTWPQKLLRVYDMLPLEDYLEDNYLTLPLEDGGQTCLVDCFITGLLKLKPSAGLRYIDFRKFDRDRTLCKELCRLPILWMKPENREVERIHEIMTDTLDVDKDKVQRYLNRINVVYQAIEGDFKHENNIGPVTVLLDLKVGVDDVPLGLSLQHSTPFKFASSRVWMKHIPDVTLTPCNLGKVIDSARLTHFEFDDPLLPRDEQKFTSLLDVLGRLRNLSALSLPSSLDAAYGEHLPARLGETLRLLKCLQRLNLAHCNLQGHLSKLMGHLPQRLSFLNLRDCRLSEEDLFFLSRWPQLPSLRELNLSCNNLTHLDQVVVALVRRMPMITCLSVSNCMLAFASQLRLAREFLDCPRLKVVCMHCYVPLPLNDNLELLSICSSMPRVQKLLLLPGAYAFPGNSLQDRRENKIHMLLAGYRYLDIRGRGDIVLE